MGWKCLRVIRSVLPTLILLMLFLPLMTFGTNQSLESILYEGKSCDLLTLALPQDLVWKIHRYTSPEGGIRSSTACWRGYRGHWEIKDGHLYLNRVLNVDDKAVPASVLVEGADYPLEATWFSGELRVSQGNVLIRRPGFGQLYEKEAFVSIQDGVVQDTPRIINRLDEIDRFKARVLPMKASTRLLERDLYNLTFRLGGNHSDRPLEREIRDQLEDTSYYTFVTIRVANDERMDFRYCYLKPTAFPRIYRTQSIFNTASDADSGWSEVTFIAFIDDDKAVHLNCPPKNEPGEAMPSVEDVEAAALERLARLQVELSGWKPRLTPPIPEGAQIFNSEFTLEVVVNHGCNFTPSQHPIILPKGYQWWIGVDQMLDPAVFFESLKGLAPPMIWFQTTEPLPATFFDGCLPNPVLTNFRFAAKTGLGDSHLKFLSRLPNLSALMAFDTKITDEGMKFFVHMEQLKALKLYGVEITDQGIKYLEALSALTFLGLRAPKLSDKATYSIATLRELETLLLYRTALGDEGISQLSGLRKLKKLEVYAPRLSDKGARALLNLTELTELRLRDTNLSESTVEALAGLPELKVLLVESSLISEAAHARFAARPNLEYIHVRRDK